MRQDPPELLITLRDVATTAASFLDALVHVKREREAAKPPPPPAPPAAEPPSAPPSPPHASETPPTPSNAAESSATIDPIPTTFVDHDPGFDLPNAAPCDSSHIRQHLTDSAARSLERDDQLSQQRRSAATLRTAIHQHLHGIVDLVEATVDGDGSHTLTILGAILERLEAQLRDRSGPFTSAPNIGLAV